MRYVPLLLLCLLGCPSSAPPPAIAPPAPPTRPASPPGPPTPPRVDAPVVVAPVPADPKRWVRPTTEGDYIARSFVAAGIEIGIVEIAGRPFVVGRDEGMIGRLKPPSSATWVGLGGADLDVAFASSPGGYLYRATGLKDNPGGTFGYVTRLPQAVTWDAAGGWLVAGGSNVVWLSRDGGEAFEPIVVAPDFDVRRVLVRPDGLVMVEGYNGQGGHALRILFQGVWRRSAHAVEDIHRHGTHILGRSVKGCSVVLASDGQTWVGEPPDEAPSGGGFPRVPDPPSWWLASSAWTALAQRYSSPGRVVGRPTWTATSPAPPSGTGQPGPNACGGSTGTSMGLLGALSGLGMGFECAGVACVRRLPSQRSTDRAVAFFPRPCDDDDACSAAAGKRPYRLALAERRRREVHVVPPPRDCVPNRLRDLAGASWLVCSDGKAFTVSGDGHFFREGRSIWSPDRIGDAYTGEDGTVVVACDGESCSGRFLVRRPAALGDAGAWREASEPGLVALRPLADGRALTVSTQGNPKDLRPTSPFGSGGLVGFGSGGLLDSAASSGPGPPKTPEQRRREEAAQKKRRREREKAEAARKKREAEAARLFRKATFAIHHPDGRREVLARDVDVPDDLHDLHVTAKGWVLERRVKGKSTYLSLVGSKLAPAFPPAAMNDDVDMSNGWGTHDDRSIAVDDRYAYWLAPKRLGGLMRVARRGGQAQSLTDQLTSPRALSLSATHVYVAVFGEGKDRNGAVMRVAKDGDHTPEQGLGGLVRPVAIHVTADETLYVADDGHAEAADGQILRRRPDGTLDVVARSLGTIRGMMVREGDVLVAAGHDLVSFPLEPGPRPAVLGTSRRPRALAVTGGTLGWIDALGGSLWRSRDGRAAAVRHGLYDARGLAVAGATTFVANGGAHVWTERAGQWKAIALNHAAGFAVDGNEVFVVTLDGTGLSKITLDDRVVASLVELSDED